MELINQLLAGASMTAADGVGLLVFLAWVTYNICRQKTV
jgi:hypothetical protein